MKFLHKISGPSPRISGFSPRISVVSPCPYFLRVPFKDIKYLFNFVQFLAGSFKKTNRFPGFLAFLRVHRENPKQVILVANTDIDICENKTINSCWNPFENHFFASFTTANFSLKFRSHCASNVNFKKNSMEHTCVRIQNSFGKNTYITDSRPDPQTKQTKTPESTEQSIETHQKHMPYFSECCWFKKMICSLVLCCFCLVV